jgi:hypothetical protein
MSSFVTASAIARVVTMGDTGLPSRGLSTGMLGQAERLLLSGDAEAAGVPLHVFQGMGRLSCCCLVIVRPDHRESSEARHNQHSRPSLYARNDICRGKVTA